MMIGIDIGNTIRNNIDESVLEYAVESINELINAGHEIIIISKCKKERQKKSRKFLNEIGLGDIKCYFVLHDNEKYDLLTRKNIVLDVMIDDKMKVLDTFTNENIRKIWINTNEKKIQGRHKYDPESLNSVDHVRTWYEIMDLLL
eukprot:TRINITY_DN3863_c0_g1_i1.p1 TRINITY_DN3863_c0_g1~~TRINITY_DN3863_c0_g1_i1.p1  ORF type:complete len:145 (+),score=18.67 TRINITY_DN3863_c0_g1_i1:104-538(+)